MLQSFYVALWFSCEPVCRDLAEIHKIAEHVVTVLGRLSARRTALQFAIRGVGVGNHTVLREPILRIVGPVDRWAIEICAEPVAIAVVAVSHKRSTGAV